MKRSREAIVGTIALAAILGGAIVVRAHRVRWFPYVGRPLAHADYQRLAAKPGWQASVVDVGNGIRLAGLERPPRRADAPWVIFFGGNSASLLQDGQTFLDGLLRGADWGGAVWAYRGYDASDATPDPTSLTNDAWTVYSHLIQDKQLTMTRISVVGFSLGTCFVAAVGARAGQQSPSSIVLLAPITEIDMRSTERAAVDRYETLKYLDAIASPALVIQGLEDRTLSSDGARLVATRLKHADYLAHPNLAHFDLPESSAVIDQVRSFMEAHFR